MNDDSTPPVEMMIAPDGRILVHQLTPEFAALLLELDPGDVAMRERAKAGSIPETSPPSQS